MNVTEMSREKKYKKANVSKKSLKNYKEKKHHNPTSNKQVNLNTKYST